MWFLSETKKYNYAMLKAIDKARSGTPKYSKTDGLRVIKRFEKVNNVKFDPYSSTEVMIITGRAKWEFFFRKLNNLKLR